MFQESEEAQKQAELVTAVKDVLKDAIDRLVNEENHLSCIALGVAMCHSPHFTRSFEDLASREMILWHWGNFARQHAHDHELWWNGANSQKNRERRIAALEKYLRYIESTGKLES